MILQNYKYRRVVNNLMFFFNYRFCAVIVFGSPRMENVFYLSHLTICSPEDEVFSLNLENSVRRLATAIGT